LQALTVHMLSCTARATSSSSTCVGAELIDELLRLACDDDSHAAVVSHALEACSALACTCSGERVTGAMQLVMQRLAAPSSMDSDLSVCLLYAAAFVIRRSVAACRLHLHKASS
jgi:hypothetical protein